MHPVKQVVVIEALWSWWWREWYGMQNDTYFSSNLSFRLSFPLPLSVPITFPPLALVLRVSPVLPRCYYGQHIYFIAFFFLHLINAHTFHLQLQATPPSAVVLVYLPRYTIASPADLCAWFFSFSLSPALLSLTHSVKKTEISAMKNTWIYLSES